jgi:hypothetical protein
MSNLRFMKGEKPVVIEGIGDGKKIEYQAGKLSLVGRNSVPKVTYQIKQYLKETYGWDENKIDDSDLTTYGVADTVLSDAFILIVACDYTGKLKAQDLLEWDEDFIDRCFKAIIDLNPRFVRKAADAPDTGQAQPESHNEDGTPKTEEETRPLV